MKSLFAYLLIMLSTSTFAQKKADNQKQRLLQYVGNWASTDLLTDEQASQHPNVTMTVKPKLDGYSLEISVFQKKDSGYQLILVEQISYDATTDQIIALGQNAAGQCFIGKGFFDTNNQWVMEDHDLNGKLTQTVTFHFEGTNAVALKGDVSGSNGWQVKYVKILTKT